MTVSSRDLRQRAHETRVERRTVAAFTRADGWRLAITVERFGTHGAPTLVLRSFCPRGERGSQVRVLPDELDDLLDAVALVRSQVKP